MSRLRDSIEMLHTYNPILVMYPQQPSLVRPNGPPSASVDPTASQVIWGDYHPCSAEFFLSQVGHSHRRERSDPLVPWQKTTPVGIERLQALLGDTHPADTYDWEINLARFHATDPDQVWQEYGVLLQELEK